MLSDDELQALRDIERRLRWHSPELVQLFNSVRSRSRRRITVSGPGPECCWPQPRSRA